MKDYDLASELTRILLKSEQNPTEEVIRQKVRQVVFLLHNSEHDFEGVDEDELVKDLEMRHNI